MESIEPTPPPQEAPSPPRRPRQALRDIWSRLSLTNLQIILVILVVIGGRLIVDFGQRIIEGQTKISQQHILEQRITDLTNERQQLEAAKIYYSSPSYLETWAHGDGKMVQEGEKIVIPLYKGQPRPRPTQGPPPAEKPLPRWYVWWAMFLDAPPPSNWVRSDTAASSP